MHIKSFGNSMSNSLLHGDVIYIKKTQFTSIKINDIICFKKESALLTHRVILTTSNYLITKGDNNQFYDGKVYPNQIIGKLYRVKRRQQYYTVSEIHKNQITKYFPLFSNVLTLFTEHNIEYVILQGLPTSLFYKTTLYSTYNLAHVLMNKSDTTKAKTILLKLGFIEQRSPFDNVINHEKIYAKGEKIYIVLITRLSLIYPFVYLPNALYSQSHLEKLTNQFLNEKIVVKVKNKYFPLLSLENYFLYNCLNLYKTNGLSFDLYDQLTHTLQPNLNIHIILSKSKNLLLTNFIYYVLTKNKLFIPKNICLDQLINELSHNVTAKATKPRKNSLRQLYLTFLLSPHRFCKYLVILDSQFYKVLASKILTKFKAVSQAK